MMDPAFKPLRLLLLLLLVWLGGCSTMREVLVADLLEEREEYRKETLAKIDAVHSGAAEKIRHADAMRNYWGPLANLAGNHYFEQSGSTPRVAVSFLWLKPGLVLEKVITFYNQLEIVEKYLFWYDPAGNGIRTNYTPHFMEKGEYNVVFGSDGVIRFIDRESNEVESSMWLTEKGYSLEKSGLFSYKRWGTIATAAEMQKYLEVERISAEMERNPSSTFWGDMAGALSAGVVQGVAQANVEQRNRQLQQNQQRSALMAAQTEASAREQRLLSERQAATRSQQGGMQQQKQITSTQRATGATKQPATTVAAASTTVTRPKTSAKPALGPARAWCMQKRNGEFSCNGPLQNGGWGSTLKGALKMVDCTDGTGFTPTIGGGGELFHCGRDLKPGEKVVPASDPFRK